MHKIYFYDVDHLQAEDGPLVVGVPARSQEEALKLLQDEFLFHKNSPVNGHMYDVKFDRVQEVPQLERNAIVCITDDGSVWYKDLA